jgi:hypothetical protein
MNDQLPKDCYVMLHVGTGPSHSGEKTGPRLVVTGGDHFALTDNIWIERLDEQLAKHIQMACELTTNCSNNYGPFQFPEKLIPLMIHNAISGLRLPPQ